MGNEGSLPKWAQTALSVARRNEEIANRRIAEAIGEVETGIEIDPHRDLKKIARCFVDERAMVRFTVEGGYVDVFVRGGMVEVMGMGPVVIEPTSSNTFRIGLLERG